MARYILCTFNLQNLYSDFHYYFSLNYTYVIFYHAKLVSYVCFHKNN